MYGKDLELTLIMRSFHLDNVVNILSKINRFQLYPYSIDNYAIECYHNVSNSPHQILKAFMFRNRLTRL